MSLKKISNIKKRLDGLDKVVGFFSVSLNFLSFNGISTREHSLFAILPPAAILKSLTRRKKLAHFNKVALQLTMDMLYVRSNLSRNVAKSSG